MRIHASTIKQWLLCKRKWKYGLHVPRGTHTYYTARGTLLHEWAETYLNTGVVPLPRTEPLTYLGYQFSPEQHNRIVYAFDAGRVHLPRPGSVHTEHFFRFTYKGVEYGGTADMCARAFIGDHKATGSIQYALTAEALIRDPQWVVYSYWNVLTYNVGYVDGLWLYYDLRPPHTPRPIRVRQTRKQVETAFQRQHRDIVLQMRRAADTPVEDLPRSLGACDAYGGCPYRAECHSGLHWSEIV